MNFWSEWPEYLLMCLKSASASVVFVFLKCWSVKVTHWRASDATSGMLTLDPDIFLEVAVEIFGYMGFGCMLNWISVPSGSFSNGVVFWFQFFGLSFVLISGCFILDGVECCISLLQRLRVWHWLSLGSDLCLRGWSNAGGERAGGKSH